MSIIFLYADGLKRERERIMENRKRSTLISVLIVTLCIALCLGATFAFFADSIISSGNKVKSGILNVDLQLLTKNTEDDWVSIKKDSNPIFSADILWEPGYTEVKVLRVVNNGDLAIKWEARYFSENEMTDIAEVIDVYVNPGATANKYPTQRSELESWTKYSFTYFVNNIASILHGTLEGTEDANNPNCAYFGIALKMQEGAGNKYQDDVLGAFDIQIVATQFTREEDVFGTDYDEDATFPCNHPTTETIPGISATCTSTGLTDGKKCSSCSTIIVAQNETPLAEHTEVIDAAVAPSCTQTGLTQGSHCSVCSVPIIAQQIIPTSEHTESDWIIDVYPTYTSTGSQHTECTVCGVTLQTDTIDTLPYSEGLEYELVEDPENGNYYKVVGIGTYSGTDVIIPATHIDTEIYAEELPVRAIGASAFKEENITSVSIPNSVTTIETYAFRYCSKLASVTFGDGSQAVSTYSLRSRNTGSQLESIGNYAFGNCTSLKSIVIPDSVTSIASGTFYGCNNLESITLPFVGGSIKTENDTYQYPFGYIFGSTTSSSGGVYQYYYGSSTTSTTGTRYLIPASLKSVTITGGNILRGAFYGCSNLTSITIPEGVTTIGDYAFYNCTGLEGITIPNIITIGNYAFQNCKGLENVVFDNGNNLKTIGNYAFDGCTDLANITIPDSLTTIGNYAFRNCESLTSLTFGKDNQLKTVGDYAFNGCTSLTAVYIEALQSWCKIDFSTYGYSNPLMYAHNLYLNGELVTELVIPDDITYVGVYSFAGCTPLTSAVIPDSVTQIRAGVFQGCSNLESLTLPFIGKFATTTATDDNQYPFGWVFHTGSTGIDLESGEFELTEQEYYKTATSRTTYKAYIPTKLKSVTITGGNILYGAFENCRNLTSITLPENLTKIGVSAFYNCTGLTKINIPESVESIGGSAFSGCKGLSSINLSNNIAAIGSYAFSNCTGLTSITIPDMLTAIERSTFDGCTSLKTVTFGKNSQITSIGYDAFKDCPNITDVYVSNVATWASLSFGSTSTQRPHQNAKLHFLDENGNEVTELVIPDGVTRIGNSAFRNAIYLKSITVPNSVTEIQAAPFSGCGNLESITIPITTRKETSSYGTYYYPLGSFFGKGSGYGSYVEVIQPYTYHDSSTYSFPANLKSVTINGNSVESYAFRNCKNLTSITFTENVTSISASAFQGCAGITSLTVDANNPKYHSAGNCLIETESKTLVLGSANSIIPADGTVTSIGASAFHGRSNLTSITIPDGVTSIGDSAFYGCSSLTSFTIPEGVTSIGKSAFEGCRSLTSITIPSSVKSIGYGYANSTGGGHAFVGCYHLAEVINHSTLNFVVGSKDYGYVAYYATGIHKGMTTVVNQNDYLFYTYNGVNYLINYLGDDTDLTLPANYNGQNYAIGNYAFYGCTGLTSITIPDGVTSIGNFAFSGCTGLTNITIPDGVTSIGNSAFSGCTGLTSVTLGNSVNSLGTEVFSGCSQLTSVTLPSSLTIIGDFVFRGWNGLTNITIPDSVTSIGYYAFYNCTGLTNITISNSVTKINYNTFEGCKSLTNIIIPNSVSSIGSSAFSGCTGLTSITIPNSVTSISASAFYGCTALNSVTFGKNSQLTSIGSSAFEGCSSLKDVYVTNLEGWIGVAYENTYACPNYYGNLHILDENGNEITELVIPAGRTNIGNYSFRKAINLTSVTVPDSVTSIGSYAFQSCTALTNITIPDSITSIGSLAFDGCTNLVYNEYENGYYLGNDTNKYVVLMGVNDTTLETYVIHPNTKLIYYAFSNCSSLTSITIPDSVVAICYRSFYNCTSLTNIILPDNLINIGTYAFQNCTSLTSIAVPNSVTSIGSGAFSGCSTLESITLPFVGGTAKTKTDTYQYPFGYIFGTSSYEGGIKTTQYYYGSSTSNTTSSTYYIPSNLKSVTITGGNILYGAFYNCNNLTSITLGDGVQSIGTQAFQNCTSLTSIAVPNSVTSIGSGAFRGCSSLESITLPFVGGAAKTETDTYQYPFGYIFGTSSYDGGVATKQYYCYYYTTSTTSSTYYIPSSLKSVTITGGNILWGAFYGCSNLTSVTIPDSITAIGNQAFYGCTGFTSITIPDGVTSIGYQAFYGCTALTSITIPDGVTSIGYQAFYGCTALTSITIPEGVTSIDYNAFENCTGLTNVTIPNSITFIGYKVFNGCTSLVYNEYENGCYLGNDTNKYLVLVKMNDTTAESFTVHENTKIIYYCAFYNATNLTSITIPNGVTSIGSWTFGNCSSLTSITIPDSVTSIGASAFDGCTALTSITFTGIEETSLKWYRTTNYSYWKNMSSGTITTLTNASQNATYFTSTYVKYYWYKK